MFRPLYDYHQAYIQNYTSFRAVFFKIIIQVLEVPAILPVLCKLLIFTLRYNTLRISR